jgi:SAM-dependent methyltransferase
MPYFTDAGARTLIQEAYAKPTADPSAVAPTLYDPEQLDGLPAAVIAQSFGVGNPLRYADLRPGEIVLDAGCGAGLDVLLAARAVAPAGRVHGVDMTPAMVDRTRLHASLAGLDNVDVHGGLMEALPLPDASVDVVISNGVLNLSTRKSRALAEMHRVLRPGGRLVLADFVVDEDLPEAIVKNPIALVV